MIYSVYVSFCTCRQTTFDMGVMEDHDLSEYISYVLHQIAYQSNVLINSSVKILIEFLNNNRVHHYFNLTLKSSQTSLI